MFQAHISRQLNAFDDLVCAGVQKKFGVSFEKERENRAYMSGPEHGIHPLANAAGKGLKTDLREVDLPVTTTSARVST